MDESSKERVQLLRQLGAHERYHVIRCNLGFPPVICQVAQGKGDAAFITSLKDSVSRKIQLLLDSNTLFSCHIHGFRSTNPRYARFKRRYTCDEIFIVEEVAKIEESGELIRQTLHKGRTEFDISKAPLWSVVLQHDSAGNFVVILLTHHIITDGRGMANMMELLLSASDEIPSIEKAADGLVPLEEIPPTSDFTVEGFQLGFLRRRMVDILLSLPSAIQSYLRAPKVQTWPFKEDINTHPAKANIERHVVTTLKGDDLILNLKKQAQKHNVKTINPLLNTAGMIALCSIVPEGTPFRADIPINERKTNAKHTLYSGNYVSVNIQPGTMSGKLDVWNETRAFAEQVSRDRMKARQVFGELGYALERFNKDTSHQPTDKCPTLADAFFSRGLHSEKPHGASFSMSNLGAVQKLLPNVEAVYWSQTVHPNMSPIKVELCGFGTGKTGKEDAKLDQTAGITPLENVMSAKETRSQGGLSLTVGSRVGVITKEKEDRFKDVLIKTIKLMESGLEEGTSFADVLDRIKKESE